MKWNENIQKLLSIVLFVTGFVGLIYTVVWPTTNDGSVPAISTVLLLLGIALYLPDLLMENNGAQPQQDNGAQPPASTMRFAVLAVIIVFCLLTIKHGWNAPSLADLSLSESWSWILGVAFGGKALQRWGERT